MMMSSRSRVGSLLRLGSIVSKLWPCFTRSGWFASMRKALRLACASPIPNSRPRRRASSTETYSTRLAMLIFLRLSPLFDLDSRELHELRVLHALAADERRKVLRRGGLHFVALL